MMVYENGERVPLDPLRISRRIPGCILCGHRIAAVRIFLPQTDAMRAVVTRLREHPVRVRSSSGIAYGLCGRHLAQSDVTDRVESALVTAAAKVTVQ